MSKREVISSVQSFCISSMDSNSIEELIEYLTDLKDRWVPGTARNELAIEASCYIDWYLYRLETDEEYDTRVAKDLVQAQQRAAANELKEQELYQKLKAKYG